MRHLLYPLFLIGCLGKTAPHGQPLQAPAHAVVDTAIYAILPYDKWVDLAMDTKFDHPEPAPLSTAEVDEMETLVDSAYHSFTRDSSAYLHRLMPLTAYRRQYVAIINHQGHKEIWINFFCSASSKNWKHDPVIVDDGGTCFFQLMINLTLRTYHDLIPNGVAMNQPAPPGQSPNNHDSISRLREMTPSAFL